MLRVLNAYDREGVCNMNYNTLEGVGIGKDQMKRLVGELVLTGDIEDLTVKGFCSRYKIITKVECPDFIFRTDLTVGNKEILLLALTKLDSYEYISGKKLSMLLFNSDATTHTRKIYAIKENCGSDLFEILKNTKYIKKELTHPKYKYIETPLGLQLNTSPSKQKCLCKECGQTNPDNFYDTNKSTCRECLIKKDKVYNEERFDKYPEKFLLRKAKTAASQRSKLKVVTITEQDILEQLTLQNNCDFYTGLKFDNYKEMSIDRIDSSKGYEKGNIVITSYKCNCAKNDLSIEEFKKLITQLYNNMQNF